MTPPLTPGAEEPTVTYSAPSGPWAMPPGTGSWPKPNRSCRVGSLNGMRTMSPGGLAPKPPANISVPQKLPAWSNMHDVTVERPDAHRVGTVGKLPFGSTRHTFENPPPPGKNRLATKFSVPT